jgi:hypothetical protein
MTFDPYANQGGTAAWDPEQAAATKKAAEKLFAEADDEIEVDDVVTGSGTEGDEDTPA